MNDDRGACSVAGSASAVAVAPRGPAAPFRGRPAEEWHCFRAPKLADSDGLLSITCAALN